MDSINELKSLFWTATAQMLENIFPHNPDKWIRHTFPVAGAPDWKISDNIVFLNLSPRDDDYARQVNSVYKTIDGTVIKRSMRTRVWDLNYKAYGAKAFDIVTTLKDGIFRQDIQAMLAKNGVFLVPLLPRCVQANEIFAGQWWERWDFTLTFNEEHTFDEDVGHIEEISISTRYQR